MRRLLLIMLACFAGSQAAAANTRTYCDDTVTHPCIVQDTFSATAELKQWRTGFMMQKASPISQTQALWASGSAAPNAAGFHLLVKQVKAATHNKVKKIIDVDLRQESHLYLNGQSITLYSKNDWINLGKTLQQVIQSEDKWLKSLKKAGVAENILTKVQFKQREYSKGIDVPIKTIQTEKEVANQAGLDYVRITVSDHMAPLPQEVDQFVKMVDKLPPNTWLHFHCRGGKGRTSTFIAMLDMLHHANKASFDEIIKRQMAVKPNYDLAKINRGKPKFTSIFEKRFNFIHQFYQYSQAKLNGYDGTWSTWLSHQH